MPRHVRRPDRGYHDRRLACAGRLVDRDRLVGRVSGDTREVAIDRVDQIEGGGRIINRGLGQRMGEDHARPIDAEMELLPATPAASPVCRGGPLAFADDGEARAVEYEMDAATRRDRSKTALQMLTAPGDGRMVGREEVRVHHHEQRVQEPFGLAERKMVEEPQGQGGLDGQIRVPLLPVSRHGKCYRRTGRRATNDVTEAGVPQEGTRVGPQARHEYLAQMRGRYLGASRREKGRLLTEAVTVTGYHRKALIRAWRRPKARRARGPRRGRPTRYDAAVVRTLRAIWEAAGYPWSRRLQALLPMWLPWARRRLAVSPATEAQVRAISPRQMDRLLAPDKRTIRRRLYGRTKPGTLLKHHIPVKTDHWDVTEPGFTEVDLVSHSGDRADGDFLQSLNVTDIHTTWVETCAVMGKSQVRVQEALEHLRQALPFALRGIDSDNGSEFINAHLYRYCRTHQLQFTRGRPYKKDDNAHIEQKNWTHVRKLMGYVRYDSEAARTAMNAVYADLRLLQNLFLPSVKLQRKERVGARLRRHYDAPQTPLERVRRCPQADLAKVAALVRQRDQLDPFALAARIDGLLAQVYALANHRRELVPSTLGGAPARAKTAPAAAPLPLKNAPASVTPIMARRCAAR